MSSVIDNLFELSKGIPGFRRDLKRKQRLREMLEHPDYRFRTLASLSKAIGCPDDKTRDLLVSIGARASVGQGEESWGLIDRVGHG